MRVRQLPRFGRASRLAPLRYNYQRLSLVRYMQERIAVFWVPNFRGLGAMHPGFRVIEQLFKEF